MQAILLVSRFILGSAMSNPMNTTLDQLDLSQTPEVIAPEAPAAAKQTLDILEIMAILPHRFPFLLIDRIVEMERMTRVVAIKNVTINEPFFQGHFPDYPIMPGVLMVEAIAQTGGTLLLTEIPDRSDKLMVFTGIEGAKFRRPVVPGDQVRIEVKVLQWRSRAVRMLGVATVDGKVVCEATVMCQLVPRVAKKAAAAGTSAE
jgi:3-hydroxyacyl-[acyl-carrier-protein] dehydratase